MKTNLARVTAEALQAKYNPAQERVGLFEIDTLKFSMLEAELTIKLAEKGAININILFAGRRAYGVTFDLPESAGSETDQPLSLRPYNLLKSITGVREEDTYFPGVKKLVYYGADASSSDLFVNLEESFLQRQWTDLIDASNEQLNIN